MSKATQTTIRRRGQCYSTSISSTVERRDGPCSTILKSNSPVGQIHVRRCGIEDREAVLDIDRNIYDGHDYLPATYKTFIDDPLRYNHVLEVDGKIACYLTSTLVDEGQNVFIQARRNRPEYRNLGLQTFLKREIITELQTKLPHLTELAASRDLKFAHNASEIIILPYFYLDIRMSGEASKTDRGQVLENVTLTDSVSKIPFGKFKEYLRTKDVRKVLPKDRIVINSVAYRLDIPSNFEQPFRFPEDVYLSRDKDGSANGVGFLTSWKDPDRDIEEHKIEIYCHTQEVATALLANGYKEILRNITCTNTWALVYYPYSLRGCDFETSARSMLCLPYTPPACGNLRWFYKQTI